MLNNGVVKHVIQNKKYLCSPISEWHSTNGPASR